ncbi:MAG: RluA family pseudouridine synthase [Defluviitaleaceae bacterium]|nr:RluA family pseudouridine synthase [Defluviitaleaceae bacterium]
MQEITITPLNANQRLDKFVLRQLGKPPKSFVQKMLRKKNITVNGAKAEGAFVLSVGDIVKIYISPETQAKFAAPAKTFPAGEIDIVYEDGGIILLNKPSNLLTQPDTAGGDSLIGRVANYASTGDFAPVAINRLDKNTTGLVVCAKNLPAAQHLSKLMHDRKIQKVYLGVAHGEILNEMTLEGFHTKDSNKNIAKISTSHKTNAKKVLTQIVPLDYDAAKNVTMLKIHLHTGRSHQIRAHLHSISRPLMGDAKYGGKGAGRQMLHAYQIIFDGKTFTADLPQDMSVYFNGINLQK